MSDITNPTQGAPASATTGVKKDPSISEKLLDQVREFLKRVWASIEPIPVLGPLLRILGKVVAWLWRRALWLHRVIGTLITLFLFLFVAAILPTVAAIIATYHGNPASDKDPDRGATVTEKDQFGDRFSKVEYLPQGWAPEDSLWFYNTTQGSNFLPYDFFMALERVGNQTPFRSDQNINRYRYLPRKPTDNNPDALPVGFVKDTYKNRDYLGLTCAACHTSQLNYDGVGYRIDGGPAVADMQTFVDDVVVALRAAAGDRDPDVKARFVKAVLDRNNDYHTEEEVLADLARWKGRIEHYSVINGFPTGYGYGRVDAVGRIYNRTLEHLIDRDTLAQVLNELVGDRTINDSVVDGLMEDIPEDVITADDRDRFIDRVLQTFTMEQQSKLWEKLFIPADAPVSYPSLWDTPQSDFLQWNGVAPNAGFGALGRNTAQAMGVFGQLNWAPGIPSWRNAAIAFFNGQGFASPPINFESSVNVHNLALIEDHLKKLRSPKWQDLKALPALDPARVRAGKPIFEVNCARCHTPINPDDPNRRVIAYMAGLDDVGTDETAAANGVERKGYSGILRNQYVDLGVGSIMLDRKAPAAALLIKSAFGVVTTPDWEKWFWRRYVEWGYDLYWSLRENNIAPSVKQGSYQPDTMREPFASILAYKARSLNGIWATAPYLHNGSVPTLYDLLLPADRLENDPADAEYRPKTFLVGSREFDADKIGLKSKDYSGDGQPFTFDTSKRGNSNKGHEYSTRSLSREQRLDLLEYLKSL